MPCIKPFKAIRPIPELAERVATLPYDVMDDQEARQIVAENPYSFLRVARAEADLEPCIDVHDEQVYQRARANLQQMISSKILIQDHEANFYLYRLSARGHFQVGLVACTSVDDYLNNAIKKHEHTRPDKEQDRAAHIEACNAQTGPIFLTYRDSESITKLISTWMANHVPVYDFIANDGVEHKAWIIDDEKTKQELVEAFRSLDAFYIADGHHRFAAAAKAALQRRQLNPGHKGQEEYNYILSVLFPQSHLRIMDYNRVVRDLNGLAPAAFLGEVSNQFLVEKCPEGIRYRPEQPGTFGLYLQGTWYKLKFTGQVPSDPVQNLDVSILQNNILGPILGICDPRTDARIDFIGGIRGLEALEAKVDEGEMATAFSLYPTSITDVTSVADRDMVMPPKSTWFEPKLRSGLFVHSLK